MVIFIAEIHNVLILQEFDEDFPEEDEDFPEEDETKSFVKNSGRDKITEQVP